MIDEKIAKALTPMIIWLCQQTKQSQHAVSKAFMFFGWCLWFIGHYDTTVIMVLSGLCLILTFLSATLVPEYPSRPSFICRVMFLLPFCYYLGKMTDVELTIGSFLFVLSEYAKTIDKIPPKKKKEKLYASVA